MIYFLYKFLYSISFAILSLKCYYKILPIFKGDQNEIYRLKKRYAYDQSYYVR